MLREVILCDDAQVPAVATEWPSLLVTGVRNVDADVHVRASDWDSPDFDTWRFDASVDSLASRPFSLAIEDDRGNRHALAVEVVTRCQRLVDRRNSHSATQLFDIVLARHRELHDLSLALVRADYDHALDVWQWMLRLDPQASMAAQLAAMFHDIERLVSEAERRVEHLAADYQTFKDAHAQGGARMTGEILASCGVPEDVRERVSTLVESHERPSSDLELALLNDADALSFFSLNSSGYADYFGADQTRRKVLYTLNRLRPEARQQLSRVRLRADIRKMKDEVG